MHSLQAVNRHLAQVRETKVGRDTGKEASLCEHLNRAASMAANQKQGMTVVAKAARDEEERGAQRKKAIPAAPSWGVGRQ